MNPRTVLEKALSLVEGERASQHGDFRSLHTRFAELISAYLEVPVSPSQAAFMMVLLKVARHENGAFNEDDGVDATSYAAFWASLCKEER